jgi:uncharacterized protein (DUF1684 family)
LVFLLPVHFIGATPVQSAVCGPTINVFSSAAEAAGVVPHWIIVNIANTGCSFQNCCYTFHKLDFEIIARNYHAEVFSLIVAVLLLLYSFYHLF